MSMRLAPSEIRRSTSAWWSEPAGADHPAEVERLISLGARRIDIGQGDVPWEIMADPGGNEFCVLTPR